MTDFVKALDPSAGKSLRPRWDLNEPAVVSTPGPTDLRAKALATQIGIVEAALEKLLKHVEIGHCRLDDDDGVVTLYAHNVAVFESKVNLFAAPDVTVSGRWIVWPPPQPRPRSKTRRSPRRKRA